MPEFPVFSEYVGCPHQSRPIEERSTYRDPHRAVSPSKDECEYRHGYRADNRIYEEYLLLMRAKIIGFGKNDDIHHHIKQQEP